MPQCSECMPIKRASILARFSRCARTAIFCFVVASSSAFSQTHENECAPAIFNKYVKVIGTFRQLEFFINTLVHAQSQAILEVETGIVMSNDDGGFFGPLGLLGKTMDKVQAEINSVVIAGKRLKLGEQSAERLQEISGRADEIITVGFEMVGILEAGRTTEATHVFMERTLPAQKDALGATHTVISDTVSQSSKSALKCR